MLKNKNNETRELHLHWQTDDNLKVCKARQITQFEYQIFRHRENKIALATKVRIRKTTYFEKTELENKQECENLVVEGLRMWQLGKMG